MLLQLLCPPLRSSPGCSRALSPTDYIWCVTHPLSLVRTASRAASMLQRLEGGLPQVSHGTERPAATSRFPQTKLAGSHAEHPPHRRSATHHPSPSRNPTSQTAFSRERACVRAAPVHICPRACMLVSARPIRDRLNLSLVCTCSTPSPPHDSLVLLRSGATGFCAISRTLPLPDNEVDIERELYFPASSASGMNVTID